MIEVEDLSKHYGAFTAVDRISFSVPKGQILGFIGPNGAGKSTTMKMITGFLEPSSGNIRLAGFDSQKDPISIKERIGYLPESAPLYNEMTVSEFLRFIAEIRQLSAPQDAIERMKSVCFLSDVWHKPIETLSKGYRQRVGFAQALIHDPPVLILDEPTDGLDPNQKHEVRQLIKNMAQEKTIILSTHILEEVEAVCQRVLVINKGRVVTDATPEELLKQGPLDVVFRRITLGEEASHG